MPGRIIFWAAPLLVPVLFFIVWESMATLVGNSLILPPLEEIGALLADRDPETRENRYPRLELLRLAVARRVYTNNHMDYVAAALKNVYDRRESIRTGYRITRELPVMRHFTIELERVRQI